MTELQTTVEFSVELYKFYNVDLFQRGYYQIRTCLRLSPRYSSKMEVSLPNDTTENGDEDKNGSSSSSSSQIVFPSCVVNGSAVSKTFQILYRNEEVSLEDVALFKVHLIVDSRKIEDCLLKADFQLTVELWFTEHTFGPDQHNSIQCVSSRTMKLHLCPLKGLHHHLPVLFDYFHLSAVTLTIHGCLLAIHQPYVTVSKPGKQTWLTNSPKVGNRFQPSASLESVLFGNVVMRPSPSITRLNQARYVHHNICTLLLSSYESLQNKLIEYMKLLPPWQQLKIEVTDCYSKLRKLKELTKVVDAEDELLAIVNSDIAQLCAENIILWQQFLESFTLKDRIQQHLTREHHLQRVKRFAEGFFVIENTRQSIFHCAEQSYQMYLSISDSIRKTKYFASLPSLAIECPEMDGNAETLPVIFEDHYQDLSKSRSGTKKAPSAISVHDIGFDVSSTDEIVSNLPKKPVGSDTELWRLEQKQNKLQNPVVKEPKSVGCFSTGITPKSSMSSEDLYYVGSRAGGSHAYKRKVTSLPRGCASVEETVADDNNDQDTPSKSCVGPKTSASAEQIARLRQELNRCGLDGRYFRTTSSAAIPKFIKAKRQQAFRISGSKSLSAAEEESVKLAPKSNRQTLSIPRLETVPLFPRSSETVECASRSIVTSASMDLGTSKKSHMNGSLVPPRQSNQFRNHQWSVDGLSTKTNHLKVMNDTFKQSAETAGNRVTGGSSSLVATRIHHTSRNVVNDTSSSSSVSNKESLNGSTANPAIESRTYGVYKNAELPIVATTISNNCAKTHPINNSTTDPIKMQQKAIEPQLEEVNCLKQKLKESLKLELNDVHDHHHHRVPHVPRRVGTTKVRKRFGGFQLMQSLKNNSPGCSTSSDSVVLTGYKKLEQSESLPVGLGLVGQRISFKPNRRRTNPEVGRCRDGHILEELEDTDDDLFIGLEFGGESKLHKRKVTRSMPNVSTVLKERNVDVSLVTSESMPDLGSEATEADDPASTSLLIVQNHRRCVDGQQWSSSDSTRVAPKATVENSDTEENLVVTPRVECPVVDRTVTRNKIIAERGIVFQKKKKKKKRKLVLNRTRENEVKKMNKGRVINRHHKRSSSGSSSSSTSERSGWVSSECSSLGTSTSDTTGECSPPSPTLTKHKKNLKAGVADNGVVSSTEEEKHIYEEIHLPPEEFRDPSPPKTSIASTKGISAPSPLACSDPNRRRHRQAKHTYETVGCTTKKGGNSAEMTSSSDVTEVKPIPRQRPQLTRSRAVRNQQNHAQNPRVERDVNRTNKTRRREPVTTKYLDTKCTILEMFTDTTFCGYGGDDKTLPLSPEFGCDPSNDRIESDVDDEVPAAPPPPRNRTPSYPKINDASNSTSTTTTTTTTTTTEEESRQDDSTSAGSTLVSQVGHNTVNFVKAKEEFKKQLNLPAFLYSDCPLLASNIPYFHVSEDYRLTSTEGLHLVICVHGLDGNSADLRLVKTYLELGLPCSNLEFLMSERNQGDTFSDFDKMTDKLVAEILYHIEVYRLSPARISFIGHSLGNIIIRSALTRPQMKPLLGRLHTFLSLSGPHLGTLYNSSGLVNVGLWFMQKWKKSGSLLQLSMKDATDIRRTFLYRLSQKPGLEYFKNILLFGSSQDRYVPIHSARIELCKASLKDVSVQGMAYRDMVHGLLQPVARNPNITFVRYDVHHALPNTANSLIGRAAHIAVLDSELFIEKFLTVCGLKYFK